VPPACDAARGSADSFYRGPERASPGPWQTKLEAHGEVFIPFRVAKCKVGEVQNDMLAQRDKHVRIVKQVEVHYREIAREQEEYYLAYIDRLNKAALERDQQQCALLAKVRSETNSYRGLAEAKCQELENEIAALQAEIAERDLYITTARDAMAAMQSESEVQLKRDADDAAGLRQHLEQILQAELVPELSALGAAAAELRDQVEQRGRDGESERSQLRDELACLRDELQAARDRISLQDTDQGAAQRRLEEEAAASAAHLASAEADLEAVTGALEGIYSSWAMAKQAEEVATAARQERIAALEGELARSGQDGALRVAALQARLDGKLPPLIIWMFECWVIVGV
jgi:hypothetical protein